MRDYLPADAHGHHSKGCSDGCRRAERRVIHFPPTAMDLLLRLKTRFWLFHHYVNGFRTGVLCVTKRKEAKLYIVVERKLSFGWKKLAELPYEELQNIKRAIEAADGYVRGGR